MATLASGPLLEATNLSHSYDYPLFDSLSISINSGDFIAIMGRSGLGKSTLLHILSSFVAPNSGRVMVGDNDLYSLKQQQLEHLRRDYFGMIFQAHYLFKGMSVSQNLKVASLLSGFEIDDNILDLLGIAHLLDANVDRLSGGEQQRVSIARVLLKRPKIIFADEPTGNLDKETSRVVMEALKRYIKTYDASLLMVTHDKQLLEFCTDAYELKDYKLKRIDEDRS